MVSTGLRLVIGSWKIMLMSLPRISRIARLVERQQVGALEADRARDPAGRLRDQAQDRIGGDGLAAAALADHRQRLAFADLERDAVDRAVDAVRRAEVGLQILDFEQRHALQPLGEARIERVAHAVAEQVHGEHRDRQEHGRERTR